MHLSPPLPPVAKAGVCSKAVVLLLLTCCILLLPMWKSVIVLCFVVRYFMSIIVLQSFDGCFAYFVFLVSREWCVALPRGAMGLSAVCNCGISKSYSIPIDELV